MYTFWFVFSIIWIPIDLWNETVIPESRVYQSIGPYMFLNAPFILTLLFVVGVIMFPLIITRARRTVWLEPHLYSVD